MSMTSTNFVSGLGENAKTASKVLRPPGGGSSDIFGTETLTTPRAVRNHMASNIFGSTTDSVLQNSGEPRRGMKTMDSHSRLFGEPERPFTPAKNHMKSSIPIGPNVEGRGSGATTNTAASTKNNVPGATNGSSAHVNGNGIEKNGKFENGDQHNNVTKTALAKALPATLVAVPISPEQNNSENDETEPPEKIPLTNSDDPTQTALSPPGTAVNSPRNNDVTNCEKENRQPVDNRNTNGIVNGDSAANSDATSETTNKLKPVEINGNISENSSTNTSTAPSSAASPTPSSASNASHIANNNSNQNNRLKPCSQRFPSRNPVTGMGIDMPAQRPRRLANRRDGNPVTGEGYKSAGAEINTSIPCLNGANQVIKKNRIPPGGYSSGLW